MIEKRSNGTYRVRLYHRARYVSSRTFRRLSDARAWERKQMDALASGTWVSPDESSITVGEQLAMWGLQRVPLKPSTETRYNSLLDNHVLPRWERVPLMSVAPGEVQAWVTRLARDKSVSTARQALGLLRQALDAAVSDGLLARNPAQRVRLPRAPRSEPSPLTHEQLADLERKMTAERDKVLVLVLGYGGLRWSEVTALRVKDVLSSGKRLRLVQGAVQVGGRVHVGPLKNYQSRTVVLPSMVAARLNTWCSDLKPDDLVFSTRTGGHLHSQNWRRDHLTPAAEKLGLVITPHHLRDTAATLAIRGGASVMAVARLLGHENPSTTLRHYAGYFPDDLDAIATGMDADARKAFKEDN